jgi:hypothetical protein
MVVRVIQAILVMLEMPAMLVVEILGTTVVVEEAEVAVVPLLKVRNQALMVPTPVKVVKAHQTQAVAVVKVAVKEMELTLVETKNLITNIQNTQVLDQLDRQDRQETKAIKLAVDKVDPAVLEMLEM